MIWRRDKSLAERENMQHRGSSDSRATADSHCAAQGIRNEMEMSRQRSSRDVLLIWLVKLQPCRRGPNELILLYTRHLYNIDIEI